MPSTLLDKINTMSKNTILETLSIQVTEASSELVVGTMPVSSTVHQPYGLLHGGASVVLAESLGSIGGNLNVDSGMACVGLDINANHIKAVRSGVLTGRARPLHRGRQTQVWEIEIKNEEGSLICISRLTLAVVPLK